MKLFDCKRNSLVRIIAQEDANNIKVSRSTLVPPGATSLSQGDILHFHNIDGMYSRCTNSKGETVHLVAWADVDVVTNDNIILEKS